MNAAYAALFDASNRQHHALRAMTAIATGLSVQPSGFDILALMRPVHALSNERAYLRTDFGQLFRRHAALCFGISTASVQAFT
jgi:hypothetical protein